MVKICLKEIKSNYKKAINSGDKRFNILVSGKKLEFVTAYAKYLIEHLELEYKRLGLNQDDDVEIRQDE